MNRWPTVPVAPRMPTLYRFAIGYAKSVIFSRFGSCNKGTSLIESLFHSAHAFDHFLFGVAKRDTQKAVRFEAESYARNRDELILKASLCDLEIIAKFADIEHRIECTFGRRRRQAHFRLEQPDKKIA